MPRSGDQADDRGGRRALAALPAGGSSAAETIGGPAPSKPAARGLHVVATPIGNRGDITLRAVETLRGVDLVVCEDTRVSGPFLRTLGVTAPLLAYHDHNAERVRPQIMARLTAGAAVALVSDAGTPLVSDPGFRLVGECIARGVPVTTLPGPSAPLAALVLAGLPTDRFMFAGFLPPRAGARGETLSELARVPATLVFLETAPRLADSLAQMAQMLGDRPAAVARELTKLHEEVRRGPLAALAEHYRTAGPPRGEIVVVVGPPAPRAAADAAEVDAGLRAALATMR
ncbi:MAG: 16S rRNA (cytidine(1402)-2'-O)-methyltransferase, partial [Alphaproteobacteria bacterium]|nr:16S rRNA (cytidine(1402)-2'-O)-methyltransferase [Alphaproteobacteria bacterium]